MQVTQIAIGRFHHFHLARQLSKHDMLDSIWTGYPRWKLADEKGIDPERIRSFPVNMVAQHVLGRMPHFPGSGKISKQLSWNNSEILDKKVERHIKSAKVLVALSSSGLRAGRKAKAHGGFYVCDRGSTHIAHQYDVLTQEYARWAAPPPEFDARVIDKEIREYDEADLITVPSDFVRQTFIKRGVPASKMRLIPYGGRLDRFSPVARPNPDDFTVLYVGRLSIRKGLPYLLEAFARLRHPRKRLILIGSKEPGMDGIMAQFPMERVEYLGAVPNNRLADFYSRADVMVLPSLEEGLAMVMGEALACGCPVIATHNSGASDLFDSGSEGFIVDAGRWEPVHEALTALADDAPLRSAMREAAEKRITQIGGWDSYGEKWTGLVRELNDTVAERSR